MSLVKKYTKKDKVWFTSDLHFNHIKPFIWQKRGFENVEQMNNKIIENLRAVVGEQDHLYILGDLTLGDLDAAAGYLRQIPGQVHVILGNHDTDRRIEFYQSLGWDVQFAVRIKWDKYSFFLSHYPTITENPGEDKLSLATINLYGHTHSIWSWDREQPFNYQVGCDAHHCKPISIDYIVEILKRVIKDPAAATLVEA